MSASNRPTIIKIHMLLAAFIFPAALMFLVTGGLYTWGYKGSYVDDVHVIKLEKPLAADAGELTVLVERELQKLSVAVPTGKAKVKKGGTSYKLEWTGSNRDVILEPTADALAAELTIKETTWYRQLVQLHKAKGGQLFKVYAAVLAVSLFVILATGFILAFQAPGYRKSATFATLAGTLMFALMVALS